MNNCSNQFTFYLINDNDTTHLIHEVTHEQQLYVVNTLIETLKTIKKDIYPLRIAWLAVRFGDLRSKEKREFKYIDVPQMKQVYEYITNVLKIRLPPFDETRKYTNEHLWNFFCVHRSDLYRYSLTEDRFEQYDLNVLWEEYDALLSDLNEFLKNYETQIEEFYIDRSIWNSKNEVEQIQKALTTRLTYNVLRSKIKFEKIVKYHGNHLEIKSNYRKWKTLVIQYGPAWLSSIARRCKHKERSELNMSILRQYNDLFKIWKEYARELRIDTREIHNKHLQLYNYIVDNNIL
jgi:hypothetical protein